ncbi:MAG: hypothetical protein IBJ11_12640, partial [Phycisphaerales bacterium]|nr:hypothetical protein [Phycisphaerales bacterium]
VGGGGSGARLNLLVTAAAWPGEHWADSLPTLLAPMGVQAFRVGTGRDAAEFIRRSPVHIAVVDLSLPLESASPAEEEGGERILELLARLPDPPPTLVIKRRRTRREHAKELATALAAGAFAVIDRPVRLELLLEAMRRAFVRHYRDRWPGCGGAMA